MPIISQAITELQTHIYKPVMDQVSQLILQRLGYDKIIGDRIYINTDFSTHSQTSTIENDAVIGRTAFRVDAQIRANPSSQKWEFYTFHHTAAYGIGNRQLNNSFSTYIDKDNQVRMVEMRSPVTIEMNCELNLATADLAYQAPQELFNAWGTGDVVEYVDLVYDYPIPKTLVNVLHTIWRLDRLGGQTAGISFDKYIAKYTDDTYGITVNRSDIDNPSKIEMTLRCFNLKALFSLEYSDDRPQAVKDERMTTGYTLSFVATVQFGLPTINILQYPVVVTNIPIPKEIIPIDRYNRFNRIPERHHGHADEYYDKMHNHPRFAQASQTPFYDEWRVPSNTPVCRYAKEAAVILHLTVDENENLDTVIDLSAMTDSSFGITNVVKEILYQQGEESVEATAIYTVALFKNDRQLVPYKDYTFNEDLQLKFRARSLYNHYRLVIFAPLDISKIDPKWWGLLQKYFPYFSHGIQIQIENAMQLGGPLHNKKWPDRIYIDANGNIYDATTGECIGNIQNNINYPTLLGDKHAYHTDTRVIRSDIRTYRTGKPSSRGSRQKTRSR